MSGRSTRLANARNQTAVYWGSPVNTGMGSRTYADPVELDVRWEQRNEMFIDATGQEKTSSAVVFLGQDVELGGRLYLGDLDDLSSAQEGDPQQVVNARAIRGYAKIPNLKADEYLRKVWL